jgi:hypothetical protein
MSSAFGSSGSIGPTHDAYMLVVEPHVQIAIWALVAAIAVVLVMVIADMAMKLRAEAAPTPKPAHKKIPPKKPDGRS